jgi:hypothetical protein
LGLRFDARHHALDQVRGLEADTEFGEDLKAMQAKRFVQAFFETPGRRRVVRLECLDELPQGAQRLGVGGLGVCRLQLTSPQRVLALRQVAQDVLPLVPLAALDRHALAEHLAYGRTQALGAVQHHQ